MLKYQVDVLPVYGSKGPGYLCSVEGCSVYHPSKEVALALLREAVLVKCEEIGWDEEVFFV